MDSPSATERARRVAEINDRVRQEPRPGEVFVTQGVSALGVATVAVLLQELAHFDRFDTGNDPYAERDFGAIEAGAAQVFWKIDYYAPDLRSGCETPWDAGSCRRVLTLMLAEEY